MIGQLMDGTFFENYGLLIILIVFLVFMLVFSATRRKKDAKMAEDFANNLKVGDKIKTYSGIYGKIISIKDTPNGKVCVIETGEGKNVSYMTVDVYAIYNIETPVAEKKIAEQKDAQVKENNKNEVEIVATETATTQEMETKQDDAQNTAPTEKTEKKTSEEKEELKKIKEKESK